jgi:hypothetical protein
VRKPRPWLRCGCAHQLADAGELERLTVQSENIHRKTNGILDNLTETNRESVDARIRGLKREPRQVDPRLEELKPKEEGQPDIDALAGEILAYLGDFDEAVAEGTVDEQRRFVRAFVHQLVREPGTLQARITLRDVPSAAV